MAKMNVWKRMFPVRTHEGAVAQKVDAKSALRRTVLTCLLWEDTFYEKGNDSFLEIAGRAGAQIVSPEKDLVTLKKVEEAHKAGINVIPWTANTRAEWDALVDAKVDAIISDDPAALIAYLKEKKLR